MKNTKLSSETLNQKLVSKKKKDEKISTVLESVDTNFDFCWNL